MLKNNVLSLVCYFLVSIIALITPHQNGIWESVTAFILIVVILALFTLIGKFMLRNMGSMWKNACSVLLPLIIGWFIVIFGWYWVNNVAQANEMYIGGLYYLYCLPFTVALHSIFNIVPYESYVAFGIIFVSIPSLFYFFGLQWKSKKKNA